MSETTTKIPNPIYAAAGAGDLAIERLRKLPARVADLQERVNALQDELPGRFNVLQDKVTQKVAEIPSLVAEFRQRVVDTDTDKLREAARRNANVVVTNAQAAQERAAAIYADLVTRGEQVVGRGMPDPRSLRIVAEVVPRESKTADRNAANTNATNGNAAGANAVNGNVAGGSATSGSAATGSAASGVASNGKPAETKPDAKTPEPKVAHTSVAEAMIEVDAAAKADSAKRAAKVRKN
jgi:hypothetical protein